MGISEPGLRAQKVRFGPGMRHQAGPEAAAFGMGRVLVLSTPEQANLALELAGEIGAASAGVFTKATMHTPVAVTEDAVAHAREAGADGLVAIGGGSTIGLGKAIALRTGLPQIAIPTTYAGSEATPILGQTEAGKKTTLTDPAILPDIVLYDPDLLVSLPEKMTVTSALNAMAHGVEALYARDRADETDQLALEGLGAFVVGLPRVVENPADIAAREDTQRGAWACGSVLGRVGMALHHKLCHTLGGSFGLPHAETHAIILPHATAHNEPAVRAALAPVAEMLGGETAGAALHDFARRLGAPMALRDLGLAEGDLDRAAEIAAEAPYWNPRDITRDGLRALLQDAWAGHAPNTTSP